MTMPSNLVPKKFKAGKLHSGSKHGPLVHDPKQMVAIMLSEREDEMRDAHERGKKPARKKR